MSPTKMNQFRDLNLIEPIVKAVEAEGYTLPTPVQKQAIPIVLSRQDLLACAQTGTGKTAAFALPILQLPRSARASRITAVSFVFATRLFLVVLVRMRR